jgi:hypothetical protein
MVFLRKTGTKSLVSKNLMRCVVHAAFANQPPRAHLARHDSGVVAGVLRGFTEVSRREGWALLHYQSYANLEWLTEVWQPAGIVSAHGGGVSSSQPEKSPHFAASKLRWRYSKGHEWEAAPMRVRAGRWCPYCRNRKQLERPEQPIRNGARIVVGFGAVLGVDDASLAPD